MPAVAAGRAEFPSPQIARFAILPIEACGGYGSSKNVIAARPQASSLKPQPSGTIVELRRNPTRSVRIGSISIGAGHPIAVQSMTATHTQDVEATVAQVNDLAAAGADVVRIAVDSTQRRRSPGRNPPADRPPTCRSICRRTIGWPARSPRTSTSSATTPGHLYHHEREQALAGQGEVPGRRRRPRTTARSASA